MHEIHISACVASGRNSEHACGHSCYALRVRMMQDLHDSVHHPFAPFHFYHALKVVVGQQVLVAKSVRGSENA